MDYFILDHNNKPCGPFTLFQLRGMGLTRKSYVWARGWDKWIHAGDVEEINKYVLHTPKATPTSESFAPESSAYGSSASRSSAAGCSVAGSSAAPSGQETESSTAKSSAVGRSAAPSGQEPEPSGAPNGQETESSTAKSSAAGRPAAPSGQKNESSAAHSGQKRLFACMVILFVLVCLLTSTNPNIFAHRREARPVVEEAVEADISSGHSNTTDYPNGTSVDRIFDATLVYHNYYLFSTTTVQLRQTTHFLSFGILGHVFTTSVGSL
ncbi:MAG: GYF domain-containing protein [Prevotella sp.]|nr:GYF domain-containing protein [Prevotella sp.]